MAKRPSSVRSRRDPRPSDSPGCRAGGGDLTSPSSHGGADPARERWPTRRIDRLAPAHQDRRPRGLRQAPVDRHAGQDLDGGGVVLAADAIGEPLPAAPELASQVRVGRVAGLGQAGPAITGPGDPAAGVEVIEDRAGRRPALSRKGASWASSPARSPTSPAAGPAPAGAAVSGRPAQGWRRSTGGGAPPAWPAVFEVLDALEAALEAGGAMTVTAVADARGVDQSDEPAGRAGHRRAPGTPWPRPRRRPPQPAHPDRVGRQGPGGRAPDPSGGGGGGPGRLVGRGPRQLRPAAGRGRQRPGAGVASPGPVAGRAPGLRARPGADSVQGLFPIGRQGG
jgi:hypothetical protein